MKHLLLLVLVGSLFSLHANAQQKSVHFVGIALPEDSGKETEMWSDGALSLLGNSANQLIKVDETGQFDTTFSLDSPGYYNFGYNLLYFTPGDRLEVRFSTDPLKTQFSGTNVELNNYLRTCAGSHSGSFVGYIGQEKLTDMSYVERKIDSISATRRSQLKSLKTATPQFIDIENARITADIVNTYLCIPLYRGMEEDSEETKAFFQSYQSKLCTLIREISKDEYLDVEVVRSVLSDCARNPLLRDCIQWTPRMTTLFEATGLANYLSQKLNEEVLAYVDSFLQVCPEKDIQSALQLKRDQLTALMKGRPAIDLSFSTPEGTPATLSAYKGKAIYIDLWATWCGPCLKESPAFHRLAEKYLDNKDIVFLSISTDTDKKRWLGFLKGKTQTIPEYNCVDIQGMNRWGVESIPRFILIDRDFNIFNANAPQPSSGEAIEREIQALIGEK